MNTCRNRYSTRISEISQFSHRSWEGNHKEVTGVTIISYNAA
jgi:hypothetical protein